MVRTLESLIDILALDYEQDSIILNDKIKQLREKKLHAICVEPYIARRFGLAEKGLNVDIYIGFPYGFLSEQHKLEELRLAERTGAAYADVFLNPLDLIEHRFSKTLTNITAYTETFNPKRLRIAFETTLLPKDRTKELVKRIYGITPESTVSLSVRQLPCSLHYRFDLIRELKKEHNHLSIKADGDIGTRLEATFYTSIGTNYLGVSNPSALLR